MKLTTANLIRLAGLSAMGAGILFIAIQAIHPLDLLENVGTTRWVFVHVLGVLMGVLGIFGVTGLYVRQVEKSGWLGFAGFLLLSLFFALTLAFQFIEATISPVLATVTPQYVEGFLGIASGHATGFNMGALPLAYTITGMAGYLLGGLLFGIATFRAAVLPRWAGALLAASVLLPLVTAPLLAHPYDRILAVPMSLALVWMGYALWTNGRQPAPATVAPHANLQLREGSVK